MKWVLVVSVLVAALAIAVLGADGGLLGRVQALIAPPDRGGLRMPSGLRGAAPGAAAVMPTADRAMPGGVPVIDPVGVATRAPSPAIVLAPTAETPDLSPASPPGADPLSPTAAPLGPRALLAKGWGPLPAPDLDPRPFSEAHWQGLEAIPRTAPLVESLGLPADVEGVILDDVTLPADLRGFRAGDLVTAVEGVPTPNLLRFIQASDRVREENRATIDIIRSGEAQRIELVALFERLGTANGETPAMIPPGARSPHPYQGPCLNCHRIGTTGSLAADQGDTLRGPPPPIRAGSGPPHRDRGPCTSCHRILP